MDTVQLERPCACASALLVADMFDAKHQESELRMEINATQ